VSGEARHFRDWTTLEAFLLEKLTTPDRQPLQTTISQEETHGNPARSDGHKRERRP
jgi:hypothetical protein